MDKTNQIQNSLCLYCYSVVSHALPFRSEDSESDISFELHLEVQLENASIYRDNLRGTYDKIFEFAALFFHSNANHY